MEDYVSDSARMLVRPRLVRWQKGFRRDRMSNCVIGYCSAGVRCRCCTLVSSFNERATIEVRLSASHDDRFPAR